MDTLQTQPTGLNQLLNVLLDGRPGQHEHLRADVGQFALRVQLPQQGHQRGLDQLRDDDRQRV